MDDMAYWLHAQRQMMQAQQQQHEGEGILLMAELGRDLLEHCVKEGMVEGAENALTNCEYAGVLLSVRVLGVLENEGCEHCEESPHPQKTQLPRIVLDDCWRGNAGRVFKNQSWLCTEGAGFAAQNSANLMQGRRKIGTHCVRQHQLCAVPKAWAAAAAARQGLAPATGHVPRGVWSNGDLACAHVQRVPFEPLACTNQMEVVHGG
eukprot:scaffold54740_cov17-Tisochrysis_lutea.AAC.1